MIQKANRWLPDIRGKPFPRGGGDASIRGKPFTYIGCGVRAKR